MIIGMDFFGINHFQANSPSISNIEKLEISNVIVDEVYVRSNTNVSTTSNKQYIDTFTTGNFDNVAFE